MISSGAITATARRVESSTSISYFLLDVAITNAFVLYKHYDPCSKYKIIEDFCVQLAKELIGDYCSVEELVDRGPF